MRILTAAFLAAFFMTGCAYAQDAAVINQQIADASAAGGGTVTLASGVYDLEAPVILKDGVTLRGDGSTVLRLADGVNTYAVTIEAGASNAGLRDLEIDGNGANQSGSSPCLYGQGGLSNLRIEGASFVHCRNQGIFLDGFQGSANAGIEITNYRVYDTGSHGILTHYGYDIRIANGTVEAWGATVDNRPAITVGRPGARAVVSGNIIRNAAGVTGGGISVDNFHGAVVAGNYIENVTSWGIEAVSFSRDVAITGNVIRYTGAQGIAINGQTDGTPGRVTIADNNIVGAGDNGIKTTRGANALGPVQVIIVGNSIYNSANRGIWLLDGREMTVVGNVSRLNGAEGLLIQNSTSYEVSANILTNNGAASSY